MNLAFDFNAARKAFATQIRLSLGLDDQHVFFEEPEVQDVPRPTNPYVSFKITTPAAKFGDDSKQNVPDRDGKPTTKWNSGGVRRMTVEFNAYADSHEEAYNLMGTWQTALDLEDVQANLRQSGIAIWIIGTVADLSQLLNTGYEGRAHLVLQCGIAMNLVSDLGEIDTVTVSGQVNNAGDVLPVTGQGG